LYIGNKLSSKGVNATTIDTLGAALEKEGFTLCYASSKKNPIWRLVDMCWSVVRYRNNTSVVLIDTYSTSAFWYAFLVSQLCRLLGLSYVPILHGGNLPVRLQKNPYLSRLIFKNAYRNVAPSKYLQFIFENWNYKNVIHIPNTIDIDKYLFKQRTIVSPKILWVRAFASIYNPKMAIDVLKKIKEVFPEATLCMVGPDKDGSLSVTKDYADSLNVEVVFTGGLTKEKWISLSQDYNVFINTTHFDNTPVSVMEAMALGLPVVSTNVGGIPFLLEDNSNALLVPDNDDIAMCQSVLQLADDIVLTKKLTFNARKKVEDLDWEVVKNQWIALFEASFRDLS
jgi:L-malate glycosyltransferase